MSKSSPQPQFLLLLRQPAGPRPSQEFLWPVMARFTTWMEGLRARNIVVATNGLDVTGKVLRGPRGRDVTDGPYPEAKEIVGGYVLLAADEAAALDAARDCPGLDYGMAVEVRPVIAR